MATYKERYDELMGKGVDDQLKFIESIGARWTGKDGGNLIDGNAFKTVFLDRFECFFNKLKDYNSAPDPSWGIEEMLEYKMNLFMSDEVLKKTDLTNKNIFMEVFCYIELLNAINEISQELDSSKNDALSFTHMTLKEIDKYIGIDIYSKIDDLERKHLSDPTQCKIEKIEFLKSKQEKLKKQILA